MSTRISASAFSLLLLAALPMPAATQDIRALDRAFREYWVASDQQETERAIAAIIATGAPFDSVCARLRHGRPYSREVVTGRRDLHRRNADGLEHRYFLLIPDDYDPDRPYAVRVFLHGGIMRSAQGEQGTWWDDPAPFAQSEWISVFPSSWNESLWWQASQVENLAAILMRLKRTHNVDENRVHLLGVSDGGTGAYFQAFRATTPWAAFLPFITNPAALSNEILGVEGQMHVLNVTNKPLFVVTGGMDPLYPTAEVIPFLEAFQSAGAEIVFQPHPEAGHDLRWWPSEAARIDSFIRHNPRDPLPNRITWETERTDRYNRVHWILITELGSAVGESALDDFNTVDAPPALGIAPAGTSGGGVLVLVVEAGSVAESAGIIAGDVIVRLNEIETPTVQQLGRALQSATFGATIPITVERNSQSVSTTLQFPDESESSSLVFMRTAPSGRIVAEQSHNTVNVRTTGVREYKLLLSPDQFDLDSPVVVVTNGIESFRGLVSPDLRTLLRWAAQDNDRTMLFAAEIEIKLEHRSP